MKFKTQRDKNLTDHYRKSKIFSIIDLIIIATLIVAVILCCVFSFTSEKGKYVSVYHSGKEIMRYSLDEDKDIKLLDGKMYLKILNGEIFVVESDCKNSICEHTGKISKVGERIVCAPNKVTIVINGGEDVLITGGAQ